MGALPKKSVAIIILVSLAAVFNIARLAGASWYVLKLTSSSTTSAGTINFYLQKMVTTIDVNGVTSSVSKTYAQLDADSANSTFTSTSSGMSTLPLQCKFAGNIALGITVAALLADIGVLAAAGISKGTFDPYIMNVGAIVGIILGFVLAAAGSAEFSGNASCAYKLHLDFAVALSGSGFSVNRGLDGSSVLAGLGNVCLFASLILLILLKKKNPNSASPTAQPPVAAPGVYPNQAYGTAPPPAGPYAQPAPQAYGAPPQAYAAPPQAYAAPPPQYGAPYSAPPTTQG